MTSSLSSFAQYKNVNISKPKKDTPKKEIAILPHPKKPLKQAGIILHFTGTLKQFLAKHSYLVILSLCKM